MFYLLISIQGAFILIGPKMFENEKKRNASRFIYKKKSKHLCAKSEIWPRIYIFFFTLCIVCLPGCSRVEVRRAVSCRCWAARGRWDRRPRALAAAAALCNFGTCAPPFWNNKMVWILYLHEEMPNYQRIKGILNTHTASNSRIIESYTRNLQIRIHGFIQGLIFFSKVHWNVIPN